MTHNGKGVLFLLLADSILLGRQSFFLQVGFTYRSICIQYIYIQYNTVIIYVLFFAGRAYTCKIIKIQPSSRASLIGVNSGISCWFNMVLPFYISHPIEPLQVVKCGFLSVALHP